MSFKKVGFFLFLFFSLFPITQINAETNAGFVPSNIWYSKDPFEEGDKVKIYTVIFNGDVRELSGTVSFFDNTTLLGKKSFTVIGKGVKDVSIDWTVNAGEHKIFGKIDNAKYLLKDGQYESITLKDNTTEESSRNVKKKIVIQTNVKNLVTSPSEVDKIAEAVKSKTPYLIQKPILGIVNTLESIREDTKSFVDSNKTNTQNDIDLIKENEKKTDPEDKSANISKPFKYAKLFFLKIASFVIDNKIIFYIAIAIILIYMLRYIWRLFL